VVFIAEVNVLFYSPKSKNYLLFISENTMFLYEIFDTLTSNDFIIAIKKKDLQSEFIISSGAREKQRCSLVDSEKNFFLTSLMPHTTNSGWNSSWHIVSKLSFSTQFRLINVLVPLLVVCCNGRDIPS